MGYDRRGTLGMVAFVVVLASSVGSLWALIEVTQPGVVAPGPHVSALLTIRGDGWTVHYRAVGSRNNTVFGILREAADRRGFPVGWFTYNLPPGILVTAINGTANGVGGRFWQYYVDGVYGDRAADRREIHDGDLVLWIFDVPQGGG